MMIMDDDDDDRLDDDHDDRLDDSAEERESVLNTCWRLQRKQVNR